MSFIQVLLPFLGSPDCAEISAMGYFKFGKYPISSSYTLYGFLDFEICRKVDCRFSEEKNIPRKKYVAK